MGQCGAWESMELRVQPGILKPEGEKPVRGQIMKECECLVSKFEFYIEGSWEPFMIFNRLCPCGSVDKESAYNVGDQGSIPGLGRSSGERRGYPLQYSGLENSMGHKELDTIE